MGKMSLVFAGINFGVIPLALLQENTLTAIAHGAVGLVCLGIGAYFTDEL